MQVYFITDVFQHWNWCYSSLFASVYLRREADVQPSAMSPCVPIGRDKSTTPPTQQGQGQILHDVFSPWRTAESRRTGIHLVIPEILSDSFISKLQFTWFVKLRFVGSFPFSLRHCLFWYACTFRVFAFVVAQGYKRTQLNAWGRCTPVEHNKEYSSS